VAFAESGFPVTFAAAHAVQAVCAWGTGAGIDVDAAKVDAINAGRTSAMFHRSGWQWS